jgi:hypothetical protein
MSKAPLLCSVLLSAAAISTAAIAQSPQPPQPPQPVQPPQLSQPPQPLYNTGPGTYSTQGGVTYGLEGNQFEETYGPHTVVHGPNGDNRVYSTYGNQTYGPRGGLSFYTKGTTTYGLNGTTAQTLGNQTVIRHSNGTTTVCYNAGNQRYCN